METCCAKCESAFTCRADDIDRCQCNAVMLSPETTRFLSETYYPCLCKNCLSEIDQKVQLSQQYEFPIRKAEFVEGLHYYIEGEFWVFTELYHMLRGNCCQSGCRHCVYGFKKFGTLPSA